jgi:hypothetical protein
MFVLISRTVLASIMRFAAIIALVIFSERFEVSPLPAWTLGVFVYFLQILATYLTAAWVFRKRTPKQRETWIVIGLFVFLEILFEMLLILYLTDYDWARIPSNIRWTTLWLSAMTAAIVAAAAWQARRKNLAEVTPEGMVG